ncbi:MAG TPA: type 1 glutamine amidotransferase domain-containing protein [Diaminobutyricibacter sp.]
MSLEGRTVAFLVAGEGIEQAELVEPWKAVLDAGGTPVLVSKDAGTVQAFNHLDRADTFDVDVTLADASPGDFDALMLPGGVANGDALRTQEDAVGFVTGIAEAGKPIGVICHGGWVLIEAALVGNRTLTSWPSLQTDYRNAGAHWIDREVVLDEGPFVLVSSRKPDDLPEFDKQFVSVLEATETADV